MSRYLMVLMMLSVAFMACGGQAGEAGSGGEDVAQAAGTVENAAQTSETGGSTSGGDFDFTTSDLEVGQWIEFGIDGGDETFKIAVVGTEMNQGDECYWIQVSSGDFVGQILVEPEGLKTATANYEDFFGEFAEDPKAYIRDRLADVDDMAGVFTAEEGKEVALDFLRAVRMLKFKQQDMVMAIDLQGVADFIENMMNDPAFDEQFTRGFTQGFKEEGGQEDLDKVAEELEKMDFNFEKTAVGVAGNTVQGFEVSVNHPDGSVEIVFSPELPIVPLAHVEASGDGETHVVEVTGYGFSGAENLMPGAPDQTLPAMMFLQGMQQQMGAMGGGK